MFPQKVLGCVAVKREVWTNLLSLLPVAEKDDWTKSVTTAEMANPCVDSCYGRQCNGNRGIS